MNFLFLGLGLFIGLIFGVFFMSLCLSAKMGDNKTQTTDANHLTEHSPKKRPIDLKKNNQNILPVVEMWG